MTEITEKVEVEVGAPDDNGVYRAEKLRFTGESVDSYEHGDTMFELYECPGGYRVYVDDHGESGAYLHPSKVNHVNGETDYGLYTAEQVAEEWPEFGSTVGKLRVRDID